VLGRGRLFYVFSGITQRMCLTHQLLPPAKANPSLSAAKKEKNDNKREGRKASGSVKAFA
jgi:hypothetical protein